MIRSSVILAWACCFLFSARPIAAQEARAETLAELTARLAEETNRASRMVNVADETELLGELRNLRRLIASDAPLTIERKLEAGRAVRVKSGPLEGTEGVVVSRRGKDCLLVAVTLLQQGVSVEIDDFRLEPIY